ncbi:MAG: type II toxin-antitoxin system VapB family antitoxin [Caldimonas sp.]
MTLNIKDPEARDLAQALAEETGETMTLAVIQALRERLERVQRGRRVASAEELVAIGKRCAQGLISNPMPHGDLLYDERGLPR